MVGPITQVNVILSLGDIYLRNVFSYKQELILWKEHEEKWLVPTK